MYEKVIFFIEEGPNAGDSLTLKKNQCRLIGRHISEGETIMMDSSGNLTLDPDSMGLLTKHLNPNEHSETSTQSQSRPSLGAINRGPDIFLADENISRAHAMIFLNDSGLGIIDLHSTNGTFVGENRVDSALLGVKDTLKIGSTLLKFKFDD